MTTPFCPTRAARAGLGLNGHCWLGRPPRSHALCINAQCSLWRPAPCAQTMLIAGPAYLNVLLCLPPSRLSRLRSCGLRTRRGCCWAGNLCSGASHLLLLRSAWTPCDPEMNGPWTICAEEHEMGMYVTQGPRTVNFGDFALGILHQLALTSQAQSGGSPPIKALTTDGPSCLGHGRR